MVALLRVCDKNHYQEKNCSALEKYFLPSFMVGPLISSSHVYGGVLSCFVFAYTFDLRHK